MLSSDSRRLLWPATARHRALGSLASYVMACRFALIDIAVGCDDQEGGAPMIRGFRGATALTADDPAEMEEAVAELIAEMIRRNSLDTDDFISIFLTNTPDLRSAFPAAAVRRAGLTDVPLLCASEIDVAGAMPRVVRVLLHAVSNTPRAEVDHVYLRGTAALRADLPHG